jgi:MFS transporter, DHA1 family, multidrug resistance protein
MMPMGHVAGTASSVLGAVQVAGGALLGSILDQSFDGTIRPLTMGFLVCGLIALGFVAWAERGSLALRADAPTHPVGVTDPVPAGAVAEA